MCRNFGEIANALEVSLTDWSWAPLIFDIDNDGYNDITSVTSKRIQDDQSNINDRRHMIDDT